jgi:hypothetical protein
MFAKFVKIMTARLALLWPRTVLGREIALALLLKFIALALLYFLFVAPLLRSPPTGEALRDEFTSSRR